MNMHYNFNYVPTSGGINYNIDLATIDNISQIIYSVVFTIGILVNLLFLFDLLCFSTMDGVTNVYVINFTIADIFFLISIPALVVTINLHNWIFGKVLCKVFIVSVNQFANSLFMFIIVVDSYFRVYYPILSLKLNTVIIAKIISFFTWIINLLCMLPVIFYADITEENGIASCTILWPNNHIEITYNIYTFILSFMIPLIIAIILNCLLIRRLKKPVLSSMSRNKCLLNKKLIWHIWSRVILFIIRRLPFWIIQLILKLLISEHISIIVFLVVNILSYITTIMYPVLHTYLSNKFKKSYLKACLCITNENVNTLDEQNNEFLERNNANDDGLQRKAEESATFKQSKLEDKESNKELIFTSKTSVIGMTSRLYVQNELKNHNEIML